MKLKKSLMSMVMALVASTSSYAAIDLNWDYAGNLSTLDAGPITVAVGYVVGLYRDGSADNGSMSGFTFNSDGSVLGAANGQGNDAFLGFTTLTATAKAGIFFGEALLGIGAEEGNNIYSVLFEGATIATAGNSIVLDDASHTLPGSAGPASYDPFINNGGDTSNAWQPMVPEPATGLLALIGLAVVAVRRRFTGES